MGTSILFYIHILFVEPRLCVCVCVVSLASDSSETAGHHSQTSHNDCLRDENASRVNYIDHDLHSRSQTEIKKIINA